ncbi:peptidylprolyl isomerase [Gangjinia marincola]|uniref:peptidylprolyl isomerase n=1 Tax=Gangjinia marincola TaxID=578463 RepID=A0ABP3XYU4_9FLAO
MKKISIIIAAIVVTVFSACKEVYPDLSDGLYAEIETNKGTFVGELFYKATPLTVANFVSLAEGSNTFVDSTYLGKNFYDGISFHRVIKDFMIQGGDPMGTGSGGPGYKFEDEIVDSLQHDGKGYFSMANSGPATNGSQFFVTLKETPWLNGKHTVFGKVVKGQEVVDSIGAVETVKPGDKPVNPVTINTVTIIRKGKEAKDFDAPKIFENIMEEAEVAKAEAEKKAQQAIEETKVRLADLKEKAEEMPSGLKIYRIKDVDGEQPKSTDKVSLDYAGYFEDGKIFDTNMIEVAKNYGKENIIRPSLDAYKPIQTTYSADAPMIPGFKEAMLNMQVGDRWVVFIPTELAWGERGSRGTIPPNADVVFDMEIVGIN